MPTHYGFDVPATPGIYLITNTITRRRYVGSAVSLSERCRCHFKTLRAGKHANPRMQREFNKYGQEAFVFEVLELVACKELLLTREQHYIDTLSPELNIRPRAASNLGIKFSETARINIGKAKEGIKFTEDHKRKIGEAHKGKAPPPMTPEGRARLGKATSARKGDPRYKHTEASLEKLKIYQNNRPDEHREKLKKSMDADAEKRRQIALTRTEKRCTVCKEVKPLECFHRAKSSMDGRIFRCKECDNRLDREERLKKGSAADAARKREIALTRTKKKCTTCTNELPLDCFSRHKTSLDGRLFRCRECRGKMRRAEYAKQKNPLPFDPSQYMPLSLWDETA